MKQKDFSKLRQQNVELMMNGDKTLREVVDEAYGVSVIDQTKCHQLSQCRIGKAATGVFQRDPLQSHDLHGRLIDAFQNDTMGTFTDSAAHDVLVHAEGGEHTIKD